MDNSDIALFFENMPVSIYGNPALREPQREGYYAILQHFADQRSSCYVQLPVGCGKTGLMGITPFRLAQGRVLIIAPNLTIRSTILRELNVADSNCFYAKRGVFTPTEGPFLSELKTGANIHDCDAAHMVVANIQQFAGRNNKWFERFPPDYFNLILVDEGHHNVAQTWRRLFDYFADARVVSYTATPMRSDGQLVLGERVYAFSYTRSMMMGFISPIHAVFVKPEEISFTAEGKTQRLTLDEVLKMREKDWFSKGIALSEECNRHVVQGSIAELEEIKRHGAPRQVIAVACSIRHAEQVASLYREHGLKVSVLHSDLGTEEREQTEAALRGGLLDVVVQVAMLGEGYDLGTLSVAAVFRPYRTLSPYIQFVGRILRLAIPEVPTSPGNRVSLVSHVGLNDERWWEDFKDFDREDQRFFAEFLGGEDEEIEGDGKKPRMTLRPFMRVLEETVEHYVKKGFITTIDEALVSEFLDTIRQKGFDPAEFGLSEEVVRRRLELGAAAEREVPATRRLVQPQAQREALRPRVYQEARSIADVVANRLGLKHAGRDLLGAYAGKGDSNASVLIALASGLQNKVMGIDAGKRNEASMAQLRAAIEASADIADSLTAAVRAKIGDVGAEEKITSEED